MNILIIGNGPAAISAIEAIRGRDRDSEITVVSKEKVPAYTPCFLHRYLSGEVNQERLYIKTGDFYDEERINTILGAEVTGVLTDERKVRLSDRRELRFDRLLIAAGSTPLIPRIPGIECDGVFTFKTLSDVEMIKFYMVRRPLIQRAVIMGAGFIGLEVAEALHRHGLLVMVLEREDRILPRVLDDEIAAIVRRHIEGKGVEIITGVEVISIEKDRDKRVKAILLNNGNIISCNLLVMAVGVRPNLDILVGSRINTDRGIIVDERMQTNIPGVYAAGDIAELEIGGIRRLNPIHMNATKGGCIAGCNMAGLSKAFDAHLEDMNVITLFGLSVLSIGTPRGERIIGMHDSKGLTKIYTDEIGRIKGVQIVGDVTRGGVYLSLMRRGIPIKECPSFLGYGFSLNPAKS